MGKATRDENRRLLAAEFTRYTVLNVCGMIALSCYILADTFFISQGLGTNGLTALNLAIPVYSLVHGCGLMLGMGGATRYSISLGQEDKERANEAFSRTLRLAALFAAVFVLAGLTLSRAITSLLQADEAVFAMTETYLRVILLFSPAFLLNDCLICFVRNDGNPRLSMIAMITGSLANVLLDYVFIFPLQLGIFGAVLATGLAPVISIGVLSIHVLSKRCRFRYRNGAPSLRACCGIAALGVPSLVTEIASGLVILVFNFILLGLQGNTAVAAYGVVANLSLVITAVYTGIAQGMQPLASRQYGAGRRSDTEQLVRWALAATFLLSVLLYIVISAGAGPIASVFNREGNAELQRLAVEGMRLYFLGILFSGFNIILSTFFTSTEQGPPAQAISLARGLVVILPAAFLLSALFQVTGVWLSYPAAEAITSVLGAALFARWKRMHRAEKQD